MSRSALTLAAFAALAAGCGGGDPEVRTVTVPAGGSVSVIGEEYSFDPSKVVVQGPGALTLTLRNEGSLAHNLKVVKDGDVVGGTRSFLAGRSESARVTLERGDYEMVCTVGDHAELGMKGTLRVN